MSKKVEELRSEDQRQYSDTDSSKEESDSKSDTEFIILEQDGFDDSKPSAKLDRQDSGTDDDEIDDNGIMADIPYDKTYQLTKITPGSIDYMENGQNLPYVSNCRPDRADVESPKQELT